MKPFAQLFIDARAVGTPCVAVRTFDPASTIRNVRKSLDAQHTKDNGYNDSENTPLVSWDSIHGLKGLNTGTEKEPGLGTKALLDMKTLSGAELAASVELAIALGILEYAVQDLIVFVHNPQLKWPNDSNVIQGIWNLRDTYKANGNMIVLLIGPGDVLPTELQQDVLVLDEPLPTRDELAAIVIDTFKFAGQEEKYKACKTGATKEVVKATCDAGIGLPAFPFEQSVAMTLDKVNGTLDIEQMWDRKRNIISQRQGMTFTQPKETLADMYGNVGFASFAKSFMEGPKAPNVILRADELEKQFAGNGTDTSGSTGKQMAEFLSWIEDNDIVVTLLLGLPGSSKSWSTACIAGQYKKPLIKYDLAAMEDKHVGEGAKILRGNERAVEAISDKKIWLICTANSLRGIPPELISRCQVGGIYFFDVATDEEKQGIMNLKVKKYGLESRQPLPEMTNWAGRDINNCARKAEFLGISLVDAAKQIVPLMTSHREDMDALRQAADGRFLSASHEGIYQYTKLPEKTVITPQVVNGRRMR